MQETRAREVHAVRPLAVTLGNVQDFCILMYLCGLFAHKLGSPIDIMIRYGSFMLCVFTGVWYAVETGRLKVNRYNGWMIAFIAYVVTLNMPCCADIPTGPATLFHEPPQVNTASVKSL